MPTPPPTLTPTPTVIPGPFKGQPTIPYPSDEVVQELGIIAYQVVGEQYVALSKEGYVVAQALTNEKGGFTGWQRTLPFDVETNLVVPHPQETNPELFDLTRPDAPIPQFVNAMQMAGIEVTTEQVAQAINFRELKDKDGNPFIIAAYNLDPDPSKTGETLERPIPLMIAQNNENGEWGWVEVTPSNLGTLGGVLIGNMAHPTDVELYHDLKENRFDSIITITDVWSNREKIEGEENMTYIDEEIAEALDLRAKVIRVSHLVDDAVPGWLESKNGSELEQITLNHVEKHMRYIFKKVKQESKARGLSGIKIEFNVTNEIWNSSLFSSKLGGRNRAILVFFKKATDVRNQIQQEKKDGDPDIQIELGLSQADSHYLEGVGYKQLLEILTMLELNGVYVDYVDLHGHEKDALNLPALNSIDQAIKNLRLYKKPDGSPIKVRVGEYDFNIMKWKDDPLRYLKQAERYYWVVLTALSAGVDEFSLWGVADPESWFETDTNEKQYLSPDADALVFDDNGNPKPSYFAILAAILDFISTQQ